MIIHGDFYYFSHIHNDMKARNSAIAAKRMSLPCSPGRMSRKVDPWASLVE